MMIVGQQLDYFMKTGDSVNHNVNTPGHMHHQDSTVYLNTVPGHFTQLPERPLFMMAWMIVLSV